MVGFKEYGDSDYPPSPLRQDLEYEHARMFFSNRYAGRIDLFEELSVWEDERYRQIQGTYPVISLSFAGIKADNVQDAKFVYKVYKSLAISSIDKLFYRCYNTCRTKKKEE